MRSFSPRTINIYGFLFCAILLFASYYFEYIKGMTPCLLCLLQRWAVGVLTFLFLLAAVHNPKGWSRFVYPILQIIVAGLGATASARQVWLQHQPVGSITACVPSLNFLLQTRPLHEVIKLMFHGGQDCALILWKMWGLTMAEWMLLIFLGIMLAIIVLPLIRKNLTTIYT